MDREKQSAAERRQAGLKAAESGRNLKRHQERSQDVADRAHKMLLEEQKRHDFDYGQAAGPFAEDIADFQAAVIRFLNTEADVGLNLARFTAESPTGEKRARNHRNAREAYDTVIKHLDRTAATSEELEALHQKMATLRELLKSLGERL
jgi:hypothetical protein